MTVLPGSKIRLLKTTYGINISTKKPVMIMQYEVVMVIKQIKSKDVLVVRNIFDEDISINTNTTLFKIIAKPRTNGIKKSTNRVTNDVIKIDAADGSDESTRRRAMQKMQVIVSNMMDCDDILSNCRYMVAAMCANMCISEELDSGQSNKLIMLSSRLITKANNYQG